MLKQIHKHQKITIVVLSILACSMLIFGVDLSNRGEDYAIKVNDTEVSYAQYAREKEQYRAVLQQQYGEAYKFIVNNPNFSIDEKLKEKLIPQILIEQKAREDNLNVSDEILQRNILELFSNGNYENYLKYSGQSARAFEASLKEDLINQQIIGFVTSMSKASEKEAKAKWKNENKEYEINYLTITKDDLRENIKKPSEEILQKIYEEEASTFEKQPRIKYKYVVIDSKDATKLVDVLDEDIELYYTENQDKYREAKTANYDIVTLKPKKSIESKKLKEGAETLLGEAIAQDKLDTISNRSSNLFDIDVLKDQKIKDSSNVIAKNIFRLNEPGFTNLIEENGEFKIIKVNYFAEGELKELNEVRDEIISLIKQREAPAYLAIYGEDLFNELKELDTDLETFAKNKNLKIDSTELLEFNISPPSLNNLTERVYEQKDEKQQLVELSDKMILVEVSNFKEREIPELKEVKNEVIKIYEKQELEKLLQSKEDELKELLNKNNVKNLREFSKLINVKIETKGKATKLSSLPSEIINPELSKAVFNTLKTPKFFKNVYSTENKIILAEVSGIQQPDPKNFEKVKKEYIKRKSNSNSELVLSSLINKLKKQSEIIVKN